MLSLNISFYGYRFLFAEAAAEARSRLPVVPWGTRAQYARLITHRRMRPSWKAMRTFYVCFDPVPSASLDVSKQL